MQNMLATHYGLPNSEPKVINGVNGFKNDEYFYFTMSSNDNKALYMEQTTVAYFLFDAGYRQTTIPIPNISGNWTTLYEGEEYMLLQVQLFQPLPSESHGQILAHFHQLNINYPYEPELISSYGKWKALWIDKLTVYEEKIKEEAEKHPCSYYEQVMDLLPYLIGISENAIQYVQESEYELRFNEVDQGTITFQRYQSNIVDPIIWLNELTYDHPVRDLAEYIRRQLLQNDEQGLENAWMFVKEYETIRPLSPFCWRLLLARLVFPIHFFDVIEEGFSTNHMSQMDKKLANICNKQELYEQNVRRLFEVIELNHQSLHIPMVQWL